MNKNLVYLTWKSFNGKVYKVAKLYKTDNEYCFEYIEDNVKEAIKDGFNLLLPFPNINATYKCNHLFAIFGARLPDKRRPEIKSILKTYNLEEYDEFELLKRSGAKLPTDNFQFIL